jgi:hypothetical protein
MAKLLALWPSRIAWKRGLYRLVAVLGLVWVALVVIKATSTAPNWQSDEDLLDDITARLRGTLVQCGTPCSTASVTEPIRNERELVKYASDSAAALQRAQALFERELATAKQEEAAARPKAAPTTRPAALQELEERAAAARLRYLAARKRYESGEGYAASNWLAMNDAHEIYQSADQHYKQELNAYEQRQQFSFSPPTKSESFAEALKAIASARKEFTSTDYSAEYQHARELAQAAHRSDLRIYLAVALLPLLAIVAAIEVIAWIIRGFLRPPEGNPGPPRP